MPGDWPPPDLAVPVFDKEDLRLVSWEAGLTADDAEDHPGCYVLQTGRCGDHFAIVLPRGARIVHHEDGRLEMNGALFRGHGPVVHDDPGCPAA